MHMTLGESQPPSTYAQGGLELSTHSSFGAEIVRQYKTLRPQFLFFNLISIFLFSSMHLTLCSNFQAFRGMPPWAGGS